MDWDDAIDLVLRGLGHVTTAAAVMVGGQVVARFAGGEPRWIRCARHWRMSAMVETRGLEPLTPALRKEDPTRRLWVSVPGQWLYLVWRREPCEPEQNRHSRAFRTGVTPP
jgi:hypothetical protein